VHGANRLTSGTVTLVAADRDGVLPAGFYSTTNLATDVLVDDRWLTVENPEMDCGIVIADGHARTIPMHRVREGDQIVVGSGGVRVHAPAKQRGASAFEFMNSEVSSEKPKALIVQEVAARIRAARERGGKVLAVCGPAVVHTGGAPDVARLVEGGWVDVLFAGNGFATHDIEANVLGTSLGISVAEGTTTEGGHSNHLRVINEVRRHGSIAAAVDAGYVTGGAMATCVRRAVPFVLGGSIRDDGPLPDVYTDTTAAADAMRAEIPGVAVALMLASTLHAIAVGNCLPAGVETFCVDINQAVVTKLADRGSHQAMGIVTDVGPFLGQLADALCGTAS
jgi:lysine-ketoglutarate reductase/saccharopine dehydrogenase-like protein (TIGR00300 family)